MTTGSGGKATVIGTFVGALLIGTINNGLIIMGLDVSELMMIVGGMIIPAVAFGRRPTKPDVSERQCQQNWLKT